MFGHHRRGGPYGRWSDPESPFDFFQFGRFGRRWGGPGPGWDRPERPFGRGDLKYVILELLKDQPRHGYDIIRALEERSRGTYRPSPGSVYPTLQMLEDLGYVTSIQEEGGKKVYAITDEGRRYLSEQESTVEDIQSRLRAGWDAAQRPEVAELMRELQLLGRALFRHATGGALQDPERLKRLKGILERARAEIETVYETPTTIV
ncbi:MAG TPA: PadR family transcriptional regulator [Chloroflexota bacterium]|jgi:DNA-binding PadR family transcriptional regulator